MFRNRQESRKDGWILYFLHNRAENFAMFDYAERYVHSILDKSLCMKFFGPKLGQISVGFTDQIFTWDLPKNL